MADGAFWVEAQTGNIVSSSYYFADLPAWAKELNKAKPADRHAGVDWIGPQDAAGRSRGILRLPGGTPFRMIWSSSWRKKAIASEKLGEGQATDLLSVSFSANDYVGTRMGPNSAEAHDTAVRTDQSHRQAVPLSRKRELECRMSWWF